MTNQRDKCIGLSALAKPLSSIKTVADSLHLFRGASPIAFDFRDTR